MDRIEIKDEWKTYQISTLDLGKPIRFLDCGLAIINEDNEEQLKTQVREDYEKIERINECIDNLEFSELDSVTLDIINELQSILKNSNTKLSLGDAKP